MWYVEEIQAGITPRALPIPNATVTMPPSPAVVYGTISSHLILGAYTCYLVADAVINENPLSLLFVAGGCVFQCALYCEQKLSGMIEDGVEDWSARGRDIEGNPRGLSEVYQLALAVTEIILVLVIIALAVKLFYAFGWRVYCKFSVDTAHVRPGALKARLKQRVAVTAIKYDVVATILLIEAIWIFVAPPARRFDGGNLLRPPDAWLPKGGKLWGADERDYDELHSVVLTSLSLYLCCAAVDCAMRLVWFLCMRWERKWSLRMLLPTAVVLPAFAIYLIYTVFQSLECHKATSIVCNDQWSFLVHELDNCIQCESPNRFNLSARCLAPQCGRPNPAIGDYLRDTLNDSSISDPLVVDIRWSFLDVIRPMLALFITCIVRIMTIALVQWATVDFGLGLLRSNSQQTSNKTARLSALTVQLGEDPTSMQFVQQMLRGVNVENIDISDVQHGTAHNGSVKATSDTRDTSFSAASVAKQHGTAPINRMQPGSRGGRFVQLSLDLGSLRWSWTEYITLAEIDRISLAQVHSRHTRGHGRSHFTSAWALRVRCGSPGRFQEIELLFQSLAAAYRWARGLDALLRAARQATLSPELKYFLLDMCACMSYSSHSEGTPFPFHATARGLINCRSLVLLADFTRRWTICTTDSVARIQVSPWIWCRSCLLT